MDEKAEVRKLLGLGLFFIGVAFTAVLCALEIAGSIRTNGELHAKRIILCERNNPGILISEHVCMRRDALIWGWDKTLTEGK